MAKRDEWLARAAGSRRSGRATDRLRRFLVATVVGSLVLMTIWGIGRSGFPERASVFLAGGVLAGLATVAVLARPGRSDGDRTAERPERAAGGEGRPDE